MEARAGSPVVAAIRRTHVPSTCLHHIGNTTARYTAPRSVYPYGRNSANSMPTGWRCIWLARWGAIWHPAFLTSGMNYQDLPLYGPSYSMYSFVAIFRACRCEL